MTIWTFHEPGSIPGIPGQFAGCLVTVNEDGTLDIQPLAQHPHMTDAPTADIPATDITPATEASENIEEA